jgi:ABC-type multidrug transport system ATPase subunit
MKSQVTLQNADVVLFETGSSCPLKHFLHFLGVQGRRRPFLFSFVDSDGPLLPGMTLLENMLLDSIPNSLGESKQLKLTRHLEETGNQSLMDLFARLRLLDEAPVNVDDPTRKLAALLKALVHPGDYLFLDHPERHLAPQLIPSLIQAIEFQVRSQEKIVLISTNEPEHWSELATKRVFRTPEGHFAVRPAFASLIERKIAA